MILTISRLICLYMAAMILFEFFREGSRQEKVVMALMLVPLVLRCLLIK